MNFIRIIEQNLFRDVFDQEARNLTCLPDEKCRYCGKELMSQRALEKGHCALCHPKGYKRLSSKIYRSHKSLRCDLISQDPDFNFGHGKKFYNAVERAIQRGDFR